MPSFNPYASVANVAPLVLTIPASQWSGSSGDYYITVSASRVTENSILVPNYDSDSAAYLKGPVWCVPDDGTFTIHTSDVPTDSVTIMVQFPGTMGEAQYQVLADVYSTSQTYSKEEVDAAIAQLTAKMDVSSDITPSTTYVDTTASVEKKSYKCGDIATFHFVFKALAASVSGQAIFTGLQPAYGNTMQFTAMNTTTQKPVEFAVTNTGNLTYWYSNTGFSAGDTIRGSVTYICA